MPRITYRILLIGAAVVVAACMAKEEAATSEVSVSITGPSEGDTIRENAVHITLGATGIEIAPAADARPETAHHHLYLDADFPAVEAAIPMGVGGIVALLCYFWFLSVDLAAISGPGDSVVGQAFEALTALGFLWILLLLLLAFDRGLA